MTDEPRKDRRMPEEKVKQTTRERVEQIFGMVEDVQSNFEKFARKVIVFITVIFLMSSIGLAAFGYALNKIHDSRVDQTSRACVIRNEQNSGILYVLNVYIPTDVPKEVQDKFPIVPDCDVYARKAIK